MRELTLTECSYTAAGIHTDGYNFSHIISSTLIFGLIGTVIFNMDPIIAGGVGAAYSTLMMVAKVGDAYFFPENDTVVITAPAVEGAA